MTKKQLEILADGTITLETMTQYQKDELAKSFLGYVACQKNMQTAADKSEKQGWKERADFWMGNMISVVAAPAK